MARRKSQKQSLEERVAARIRAAREAQGLSQGELAKEARTSRSYVAEVEDCAKIPTVKTLGRLAEALGLAPEELLGDSADKPRLDAADALARQLRARGPAVMKLVKGLLAGLDEVVEERAGNQ